MMAFSSVVASGCERMWLHTTWFDNISSCQGWSGWFGSMKPLTAEIHSWSHAFQQQMRASFFERCFWPKNMPLLPLCFSIYLFWKYSWVLLLNHEHQVIKQHQPTTTTTKFCYVHTVFTVHSFKYRYLQASSAHHFHPFSVKGGGSWEPPHQNNIRHDPSTSHWLQCPSFKGSDSSRSTHMRSKRLRIGSERFTFCEKVLHFAGCLLTVLGVTSLGLLGCNVSSLYLFSGNILWHRMDIRYNT